MGLYCVNILNNPCKLGCKGSIAVIITPLIALMIDQKRSFKHRGITVEFVGEAQNDENAAMSVLKGEIQLVYISPESILNNKKFRNMLQKSVYQERLVALVVDEAHCIQMWLAKYNYFVLCTCLFVRGDTFRKAFFEIGTLRSLIPKSVNVMALTATATNRTISVVTSHLAMDDPVIIGLNTDRSNIKYVVKPSEPIEQLSTTLADELILARTSMPKTVIFCRSLCECADIFTAIKKKLGPKITEPPGLLNIRQLWLVTLFTGASTPDMREDILDEFRRQDAVLRLVIASSAFGLGVDIPDIARIINWGLPQNLEDLVQETGRAGRNGSQAQAILYYRSSAMKASKVVREYAENNSVCRRYLLFKDFLYSSCKNPVSPCQCCDLCSHMCQCLHCCNDN